LTKKDFLEAFTAKMRIGWRPKLEEAWSEISAKHSPEIAIEILREGFLSEDGGIVGMALAMRPDDAQWQITVPLVARKIVEEFIEGVVK